MVYKRAGSVVKWAFGIILLCALLQYGFNLIVTSNFAWIQMQQKSLIGSSRFHFTIQSGMEHKPDNMPVCPILASNSVGRIYVNTTPPHLEDLEAKNANVEFGGTWRPSSCRARYKVAILIPYRDREEHLRTFQQHMHPFLQRQQLDYGIYVVEQAGDEKFNRGLLLNIGFSKVSELYPYDCYIFHDVDKLPEDDRNRYCCSDQPRHFSAAMDKRNYKLRYRTLFGGVAGLSTSQFLKINGFSNMFFGWGAEDDDLYNRINHYGYHLKRYPMAVARYTTLTHKHAEKNKNRYNILKIGKTRFAKEGLNSLTYDRVVIKKMRLCTRINAYINMTTVLAAANDGRKRDSAARRL